MYADPVLFIKLSIFAFLKSQWEFQCCPNFPLFPTKTHSLTPLKAIHHHLSAAGPQKQILRSRSPRGH